MLGAQLNAKCLKPANLSDQSALSVWLLIYLHLYGDFVTVEASEDDCQAPDEETETGNRYDGPVAETSPLRTRLVFKARNAGNLANTMGGGPIGELV